MKKEFLSGAAFSVGINLLVKTLWILGIELAVQRAVGTNAYGTYFSLFNFSLLFLILLDLGITQFNTRNIAQNQQLLHKNFSHLLLYKLILSLVYIVVLFVAAIILQYDRSRIIILAFLAGAQIFASLTLYFRSNLSALHHFKLDGLISVTDRFLLIFICGIFLWQPDLRLSFTILSFAKIQFLTSALTALIAFLINLRYTNFPRPKWNGIIFRVILKQSMPFALLFLIMSFYSRIDAVLLDYILNDSGEQAGIYAGAFRLFDAYSQIALILTGILLPVFARQMKQKQPVESVLFSALSILITAAVVMGTAGFWFGKPIAQFLYKEHVNDIGSVFSVLLWALIPFVFSMTFGSLLTAAGNMRVLNRIALIAFFINIGMNLAFIPSMGAQGAAITAICVHGFSALTLGWMIFKKLRIRMQPGFWIRCLALLLAAMFSGWGVRTVVPHGLAPLIFIAVVTIEAAAIGLLPIKDLVALMFRNRENS